MAKKIVGIDLDEVVRSKWIQFDRFYAQEFGEEGISMPFDTYDLRKHYEFKDTVFENNYLNEELPDDISPVEYIVDKETGEAPVDHMAFRKRSEKKTADEIFNQFLYEDFLVEIFGSAPTLYRGLDIHLRMFKEAYNNEIDIVLFSSEKEESISPSLFFLSKIRPNIRKYIFPEKPEDIWREVDIVITTDPRIISATPVDKRVVVLARPHNTSQTGDLKVINLQDLFTSVVNEDKSVTVLQNDAFKAIIN